MGLGRSLRWGMWQVAGVQKEMEAPTPAPRSSSAARGGQAVRWGAGCYIWVEGAVSGLWHMECVCACVCVPVAGSV